MRKKLIALLIFVFFLSSTGLPLTLHYCQMSGSVTLSECGVCNDEEANAEMSCCSSDEDFRTNIKTPSEDYCCVNKVIDASVREGLILNKNEIKSELKLTLEINSLSFHDFFKIFSNTKNLVKPSPPNKNTPINIFISVFLI